MLPNQEHISQNGVLNIKKLRIFFPFKVGDFFFHKNKLGVYIVREYFVFYIYFSHFGEISHPPKTTRLLNQRKARNLNFLPKSNFWHIAQIRQSLLGGLQCKRKRRQNRKEEEKMIMMIMMMTMMTKRSKRQRKEKKEPTGRKRVHALRCIRERRNRSFVRSLARVIPDARPCVARGSICCLRG